MNAQDLAPPAHPGPLCPVEEYRPTDAALAELAECYRGVIFDVKTTGGMAEARNARATLRDYRVDLEATRKRIKAPALERCRMIDAEAGRIESALRELEEPIAAQIAGEEQRRQREREERALTEANRVRAIQDRIAAFGDAVARAATMRTAAEVAAVADSLAAVELAPDEFQEYLAPATDARANCLERVKAIHAAAVDREAREAELAAERARLEREAAALAEQRERQEAAQRKADADAKAARDLELAEQRRKEAAERAEREAAERVEREARQAAEREEAARVRQAQEAEAARLSAERQRLDDERRKMADAAAAAERAAREARILSATLESAAESAVAFLEALGEGDAEPTCALRHALARERSAPLMLCFHTDAEPQA